MSQLKTFEDLRAAPVWLAHDAAKAPRNPATGELAKANDPATWGTWADTENLLAANDEIKGRGIALGHEIAPGLALYAIDLDGCRDPNTGDLAQHAKAIAKAFDSYVEVSPSRTGLKVFFMAEPGLPGRVFSPAKGKEIKFMGAGSYSTVTGNVTDANGSPREIVELVGASALFEVGHDTIDWLLNVAGPAYKSGQSEIAPRSKDESRSGYAFRLACKFKSRGRSEADFHAAIEADTGLAGDWWRDPNTSDRDRRRVWERATDAPAMPDLDAITAEMATDRKAGFSLTSFADCSARSGERYLVKGMLAPGDLGAIIGPPGAGKSVIAPLLGFRLANGQKFFGSKVSKTGVFYVAAEDPTGLERRLVGLRETYEGTEGPTLVTGIHDLTKQDQIETLAAAIRTHRPGLVIIDTLADSFPGLDENAAESMSYVVKACRALTQLGPAVILVHHTTKANDGTPRGHSLFNGALDMSLLLTGADGSGIVRAQLKKNRNGPCDMNIAFRIISARIGEDVDGDPITAACGEEATGAGVEGPRLPPSELAALNHLTQLLADCEAAGGEPSVLIADWREACINSRDVSATENADSRRKAFDRALANLSRKGLVRTSGDVCFRPQQSLFSDLGDMDDD